MCRDAFGKHDRLSLLIRPPCRRQACAEPNAANAQLRQERSYLVCGAFLAAGRFVGRTVIRGYSDEETVVAEASSGQAIMSRA